RDGNREIYRMASDGAGPVRLTTHEADDFQPAWSPMGDRIAFTSARDGNREIYLMNPDGAALVRLTSNRADDLHPSWSPDGTRLAFTSEREASAVRRPRRVKVVGAVAGDRKSTRLN